MNFFIHISILLGVLSIITDINLFVPLASRVLDLSLDFYYVILPTVVCTFISILGFIVKVLPFLCFHLFVYILLSVLGLLILIGTIIYYFFSYACYCTINVMFFLIINGVHIWLNFIIRIGYFIYIYRYCFNFSTLYLWDLDKRIEKFIKKYDKFIIPFILFTFLLIIIESISKMDFVDSIYNYNPLESNPQPESSNTENNNPERVPRGPNNNDPVNPVDNRTNREVAEGLSRKINLQHEQQIERKSNMTVYSTRNWGVNNDRATLDVKEKELLSNLFKGNKDMYGWVKTTKQVTIKTAHPEYKYYSSNKIIQPSHYVVEDINKRLETLYPGLSNNRCR